MKTREALRGVQGERGACAAGGAVGEGDLAAVETGDFAHDAQAETAAFAAGVGARERVETFAEAGQGVDPPSSKALRRTGG